MWIFTRHGFISAVSALRANGTLNERQVVVRARIAAHLDAILAAAGLDEARGKVRWTKARDYAYRVVLDTPQFVALVSAAAAAIDYPNFKHECHRAHPEDHLYTQLLGTTWMAGYQMQVAHQADREREA
ncbi:MAG: hypothetical protein ACYC0X_21880 [Pirellulaceae bacterium]